MAKRQQLTTFASFKKEVSDIAKGLDTTQISEPEKRELIRRIKAGNKLGIDSFKKETTIEDEKEINKAIRELEYDSQQAMQKMMGACLYYIYQEAKKLHYMMAKRNISNVDIADLMQSGMLALYIAVERFDLSLDVSFLTYATWWIRQHMQKFIMADNWAVKDGYGWRGLKKDIKLVWLDDPSNGKNDAYNFNESLQDRFAPSNNSDGTHANYSKLLNVLTASQDYQASNNTSSDFDSNLIMRDVLTAAERLNPKERFVFETSAYSQSSYAEIGRMIDTTRDRVRIIHKRGVSKVIDILENTSELVDKSGRIWTPPANSNLCATEGCGNTHSKEQGGNGFRCRKCFVRFLNMARLSEIKKFDSNVNDLSLVPVQFDAFKSRFKFFSLDELDND